jgi:ABC-type molybdate transport system substrate-binding protein
MTIQRRTINDGKAHESAAVIPIAEPTDAGRDPRLIQFIKLLARQAARDYFEQSRREADQRSN